MDANVIPILWIKINPEAWSISGIFLPSPGGRRWQGWLSLHDDCSDVPAPLLPPPPVVRRRTALGRLPHSSAPGREVTVKAYPEANTAGAHPASCGISRLTEGISTLHLLMTCSWRLHGSTEVSRSFQAVTSPFVLSVFTFFTWLSVYLQ